MKAAEGIWVEQQSSRLHSQTHCRGFVFCVLFVSKVLEDEEIEKRHLFLYDS